MYFYNFEFDSYFLECFCDYHCCKQGCEYECNCSCEDEIASDDITFSLQMNIILALISELSWKIIYAFMVVIALICASVFAPTIANGFFNFMVYIGGGLSLL